MATATSYVKQGLLHDIFENQAKITPDNVAVVDEWGNQITYKGLDVKSEILGRHLVHIGVKPNDCVGLYLNLGIEYTTAYIAILKAGAAYLPLDISVPKDKLKVVLDDANPTAIITTEDFLEILEASKSKVKYDGIPQVGELYKVQWGSSAQVDLGLVVSSGDWLAMRSVINSKKTSSIKARNITKSKISAAGSKHTLQDLTYQQVTKKSKKDKQECKVITRGATVYSSDHNSATSHSTSNVHVPVSICTPVAAPSDSTSYIAVPLNATSTFTTATATVTNCNPSSIEYCDNTNSGPPSNIQTKDYL